MKGFLKVRYLFVAKFFKAAVSSAQVLHIHLHGLASSLVSARFIYYIDN